MSYDFTAFRPAPSVSPTEAYEAMGEETDGPPKLLPMTLDEASSVVRELCATLWFESGYEESEMNGLAEADLDAGIEFAEVGGPQTGLEVTLFKDQVSIALPYWHKGEAAHEAFRKIDACITIFEKHAGLVVYDPQIGRAVTSGQLDASLSCYLSMTERPTGAANASSPQGRSRPWWRFW